MAVSIQEQAAAAVKGCSDLAALGLLISAYSKAEANRLETEKRVQTLRVERRQLVPMDTVREVIQRAWGRFSRCFAPVGRSR